MVNGVVKLPIGGPIVEQSANDQSQRPGSMPWIAGPENALLAATLLELFADPSAVDVSAIASPLVLVGPSGSGKSHLARGIATQLLGRYGGDRVELLTASDFRRLFNDAVRQDQIPRLQERLRGLRAFVLEDLDHLTARQVVQDELITLVDAIGQNGGLVVVTSTQPPAHIDDLTPRFVSRLHGGLTLEIAPLGIESRKVLVEQLLRQLEWRSPPGLIDAIASSISHQPAVVARRVAELNVKFPQGHGATPAAVSKFLAQQVASTAPEFGQILRIVCRYYGVPQKQVNSGARQQEVVQTRAMIITLARQLTSLSYEEIGKRLGGRDHTTVMHHHRKIESRLPTDVALRSALADLQRMLQSL